MNGKITNGLPVLFFTGGHSRVFQTFQHKINPIDIAKIPTVSGRRRTDSLECITVIPSLSTARQIAGVTVTVIDRGISVIIRGSRNGSIVQHFVTRPHIGLYRLVRIESRYLADGGGRSFVQKLSLQPALPKASTAIAVYWISFFMINLFLFLLKGYIKAE